MRRRLTDEEWIAKHVAETAAGYPAALSGDTLAIHFLDLVATERIMDNLSDQIEAAGKLNVVRNAVTAYEARLAARMNSRVTVVDLTDTEYERYSRCGRFVTSLDATYECQKFGVEQEGEMDQ